jgi:hypothetical protein
MTYVRKNHFVRPEEHDALGVQLGSRYDGSAIVIPDSEPPADVFPETYDKYVPTGVPGGRAPHVWLDDVRVMGSSLFDRFGKGFTLLRLNGSTADTAELEQVATKRNIPLTVLDIDIAEARKLYGRDLALIRPDQHIAWRGDTLPADVDALLAKVTGH